MPASPTTTRDPWFDNAKMALVTLAVVGHLWMVLPESATDTWLYDFLYVWHMPAFVLLSGYLSRSFDWSSSRLRALVTTLVVPLVLYQAALTWWQVRVGWPAPWHPFLQPLWPLWYLVALVAWRLLTPLVLRVRPTTAVAASVAVSLLGGALDVSWFSLSRVLGLLPFFVVGLVATPQAVAAVRHPRTQLLGVGCLLATLAVARHLDAWAGTSWLYFRPYAVLDAGLLHGVLVRAALLGLGLGCAVGALSLVPSRGGWFSRMGSATMVVYLLHGFLVRGIDASGVFDWTASHDGVGRLVVALTAVALSLGLASPPAVRLLGPLTDPVGALRGARRAEPDPQPAAEPVRHPSALVGARLR